MSPLQLYNTRTRAKQTFVAADPSAMARASSTEAFDDACATIVRADEVIAMAAERTLVG